MDQSNRPGRGFTLIELLVVIAIIGILLAILIPGLRIAKELATGAVCLSNQRGLITGWILYANENDSQLISPLACYDHSGQTGPWVYRACPSFCFSHFCWQAV
jgi:prepilin-type N-terminal cleavage/methylation domain-containing protein